MPCHDLSSVFLLGGRPIGRTPDSGSGYPGSSPGLPANLFNELAKVLPPPWEHLGTELAPTSKWHSAATPPPTACRTRASFAAMNVREPVVRCEQARAFHSAL